VAGRVDGRAGKTGCELDPELGYTAPLMTMAWNVLPRLWVAFGMRTRRRAQAAPEKMEERK
jgi:hypothetical protein